MALAPQKIEALPERVFRKNVRVPPLYKWNPNRKNAVINLGSKLARRALLQQVVPGIVEAARAFHINAAGAAVKAAQAQGHFGPEDEVAVLVDGGVNRPVQNVRFAGQIIYAENPKGQRAVAEATAWVFNRYFWQAKLFRQTGQYQSKISVAVDGQEIRPSEILGYADRTNWQQMSVYNDARYAVKIERWFPGEALYSVWKAARGEGWHKRVSIKFTVRGGPHKTVDGRNIGEPAITIGRLGDFASRGPRRKDF
jgi:hypothetical protein